MCKSAQLVQNASQRPYIAVGIEKDERKLEPKIKI